MQMKKEDKMSENMRGMQKKERQEKTKKTTVPWFKMYLGLKNSFCFSEQPTKVNANLPRAFQSAKPKARPKTKGLPPKVVLPPKRKGQLV